MSNELTIATLLDRNARFLGARTALRSGDMQITHRLLVDEACRVGQSLNGLGAQFGDRIALLSRNSIEMNVAMAACELFGLICVPLNHRLATAELSKILLDCTPRFLLGEHFFESVLLELSDSLQTPHSTWLLGKEASQLQAIGAIAKQHAPRLPDERPASSDIAYIIYTSGSTGRPKGVMLTQGGLVETGRILSETACVRPDSTQLVIMPLFHVGALGHRMAYLVAGGCMELHTRFDAERVVESLASGNITDIHLAPTMLRSVLDVLDQRPQALPRLEVIKYASSPIPAETLARAMKLFDQHLIQYYGLTEAGAIGAVLHKYVHSEASSGLHAGRVRSAGQPHLGCEMEIRRSDGSVCKPDEVGEIWLRSRAMMAGYWNDPERTASVMSNGWLRTGDAARFDEDGFLYIIDRLKDMIVSGGENIYSAEVERALDTHPAVLESAVIGVPDPRWGESVHACVVLRPGAQNPGEQALIEHCRSLIASYKKPKSIEFRESLPRLQHVQKIDKQSLRAPWWENHRRGVN